MIYDNDRIVFHVDVNSAYLSWTAVKLKYIYIVVGIDYIYWSAIREILIKKGVKILIHKPYIMKGNSLPVYTYDASYVDKMIRNFKK
ncbi:hypothetical protein [Clostridium butyricum]